MERECIKFTIPLMPPSMNSLYQIIFSMKQVQLKPEIRLWKTQAKQFIPPWKPSGKSKLGWLYFNADIYTEVYFKNGKVRKLDLQNLEKCLIDCVCEKLGIGDEFIFEKHTRKLGGEKDRIEVEIGFIPDELETKD